MGRRAKVHDAGKTLAAIVGTAPVALALGVVLALLLPTSPSMSLAIGVHAVIPAWVALMCVVFNARNARRAWLGVLASLVILGLALASALGSPAIPFFITLGEEAG
jgi:hypothetical protein